MQTVFARDFYVLDQIATHLVVVDIILVGVTSSEKPKAPSFQIGSG